MAQDLDSAKKFLERQKGKPWQRAAPEPPPTVTAKPVTRDPLITGERSAGGLKDNIARRKALLPPEPSKPVSRKVSRAR